MGRCSPLFSRIAFVVLALVAIAPSHACIFNSTHCQCSQGHQVGICLRYQSGTGADSICVADECSSNGFKCDCSGSAVCPVESCGSSWQSTASNTPIVLGNTYPCQQSTGSGGSGGGSGGSSSATSTCVRAPEGADGLMSPTPSPWGVMCNQHMGVCCSASCAICAGTSCGNDANGVFQQSIADSCCAGPIFATGRQCGPDDAPCVLPGYSASPTPSTPTPSPYGAMCNEAAGVCCSTACAVCGEPGCGFDTNGIFQTAVADTCCYSNIHSTGRICGVDAPPCVMPQHAGASQSASPSPSPFGSNCNEAAGVCCDSSCAICAGFGCGNDASGVFQTSIANKCCYGNIKAGGQICGPNSPPCVLPGGLVAASASPSAPSGPAGASPSPSPYGLLCNEAKGVCCRDDCAVCADTNCGYDANGVYQQSIADNCCSAYILPQQRQCGVDVPPCTIPGTSASPSPPAAGASASPSPYGPMCNEAKGVCCKNDCAVCADTNCGYDANGVYQQSIADNCCSAYILPQQRQCGVDAPPCTIPGTSASPTPPAAGASASPSPYGPMCNEAKGVCCKNDCAVCADTNCGYDANGVYQQSIADNCCSAYILPQQRQCGVDAPPCTIPGTSASPTPPVTPSATPYANCNQAKGVCCKAECAVCADTNCGYDANGVYQQSIADNCCSAYILPQQRQCGVDAPPCTIVGTSASPTPSVSPYGPKCNEAKGVCCKNDCAVCADTNCGFDASGVYQQSIADNCCSAYILPQQRQCGVDAPPCTIPGTSASPTPSATPYANCNQAKGVCCKADCAVCADTNCGFDASGVYQQSIADNCCSAYILPQQRQCGVDAPPCTIVGTSASPTPSVSPYGPKCNEAKGVCCKADCAVCSDAGCGNDANGVYQQSIADNCCSAYIYPQQRQCGVDAPPCTIVGTSASPTPSPSPFGSNCNEAKGVCCKADCAICSMANCGNNANGVYTQSIADNCCSGYIYNNGRVCGAQTAPCNIPGYVP